jgi:hypothetical protein
MIVTPLNLALTREDDVEPRGFGLSLCLLLELKQRLVLRIEEQPTPHRRERLCGAPQPKQRPPFPLLGGHIGGIASNRSLSVLERLLRLAAALVRERAVAV